MSEPTVRANRAVWEAASRKHVLEHEALLAEARTGSALTDAERELLAPVLHWRPRVIHLQSGHGLDDVALVRAGARSVVGLDYSTVAATAAGRRAVELGVPCAYVVAQLPPAPLRDGCADLVYTGKGALIWMNDLASWAQEIVRLLRPSGHLFVHEAHPAEPLWTRDTDQPRIRPDRSYFGRSHVNDTFPGNGAVQWQWTLGQIVTTLVEAGMEIVHLAEYPEPFWHPDGIAASAWEGRLPNSFSLLARRPGEPLTDSH